MKYVVTYNIESQILYFYLGKNISSVKYVDTATVFFIFFPEKYKMKGLSYLRLVVCLLSEKDLKIDER